MSYFSNQAPSYNETTAMIIQKLPLQAEHLLPLKSQHSMKCLEMTSGKARPVQQALRYKKPHHGMRLLYRLEKVIDSVIQ